MATEIKDIEDLISWNIKKCNYEEQSDCDWR